MHPPLTVPTLSARAAAPPHARSTVRRTRRDAPNLFRSRLAPLCLPRLRTRLAQLRRIRPQLGELVVHAARTLNLAQRTLQVGDGFACSKQLGRLRRPFACGCLALLQRCNRLLHRLLVRIALLQLGLQLLQHVSAPLVCAQL